MEAVCAQISQHNRHTYGNNRDGCGEHSKAQTADDNGCRTGLRTLAHFLCRLITLRSVVFCRLTDDHSGNKSYYYRKAHLPPLVRIRTKQPSKDTEGHSRDQETGGVRTNSQCTQQFLHSCALFGLHQIDTDDTQQHAASRNHRRSQHGLQLHSFNRRSSKCRSA